MYRIFVLNGNEWELAAVVPLEVIAQSIVENAKQDGMIADYIAW